VLISLILDTCTVYFYRPFLNTFLIVKTLEIYKEFLLGLQKVGAYFKILEKRGMDQILEYFLKRKKINFTTADKSIWAFFTMRFLVSLRDVISIDFYPSKKGKIRLIRNKLQMDCFRNHFYILLKKDYFFGRIRKGIRN